MSDSSTIQIGDVIELLLGNEPTLGVVIGVDSALEGLPTHDSASIEVVPLLSGEFVSDGKVKQDSQKPLDARRLLTLSGSEVGKKVGAVSGDEVGRLWHQVTRYAARHQYQHVHAARLKKPFSKGDKIPYGGRVFDEQEISNLIDASLEFWLTSGRYTAEFERRFADYLKVRKALLVNSGSSANLISFMALTSPSLRDRRITPGDEVITAAVGFPTTISPIFQYGAISVFVDAELPSGNIDVTALEAARSPKTKAVMIAHALGNPFDLGAVRSFCDTHNLWLVEDNCDSLGAEYCINGEWRLTGTIGDIGTSSFYPPHHMTMGEGGAAYTNNPQLAKIAASFRDWGRDCWCPTGVDNTCGQRFGWSLGELPHGYDHKYTYSHFGYNLKVTDLQAAIGCAQLNKIGEFVAARRRNFNRLLERLKDLDDIFLLPEESKNAKASWFGFLLTLRTPSSDRRSRLVQYLEQQGIQTRMLFAGNYTRHPVFDHIRGDTSRYRVVGELKNSDYIMSNSFWVGVYPGLTDEMIDYMAETITHAAHHIA